MPQNYKAKNFVTSALQSTRPALTWDETDPERAKALSTAMTEALKGGTLNDEQLRVSDETGRGRDKGKGNEEVGGINGKEKGGMAMNREIGTRVKG